MKNHKNNFLIVGAGPSGLSAAYELSKINSQINIYEKLDKVGGLARSLNFRDCKFDIGPHRFFTLNKEIQKFYIDILQNDAVSVPRFTRIYYKNKFFKYPISPFGTIIKIGLIGAIEIVWSYLISQIRKYVFRAKVNNFEDWIVLNFGSKLYRTFFKSYTEKVWGIDCKEISDDWAEQRIKNLSFVGVIINPIIKYLRKKKIKTLVDEFYYPKLGAGQFYEKLLENINERNNNVNIEYNAELYKINHDNNKIISLSFKQNDKLIEVPADYFFISSSFTKIIDMMHPKVPQNIIDAAKMLKYRHHIGVKLIVKGNLFKDQWVYIHDPRVKMARVSNYINFSEKMSPSRDINPLTIEYFTFQDDMIWKLSEKELIDYAEKELRLTGLISKNDEVLDGFIIRSLDAYPVIRKGHQTYVDIIKNFLQSFENITPIGRSGMFKYNNQDHAMATGIYAARNIISPENKIDIWKINSEGIYHEGDIEAD